MRSCGRVMRVRLAQEQRMLVKSVEVLRSINSGGIVMVRLRRSPFKVDTIESDPNAFGLRYKEIITCAEALYNNRSILISGPRGIGKSSMGSQLQRVLKGDSTLLKRCGIETKFPRALCLLYACDPHNTLEQLVMDVLYALEQECLFLSGVKEVEIKPSLEVNLGVVKARLEAKAGSAKRSPATIATQLVDGFRSVVTPLKKLGLPAHINVMLDELDQLSDQINFGHFMKIVHEALNNRGLSEVTFVLAGQQGIYTRLIQEDPSFERIVRNIPLSTLDGDASNHVLEYAARQSSPPFQIDGRAKALILALSSGYPYVLHLLGDAAFLEMEDERRMAHTDVIKGIEAVLQSDKREKYLSRFMELPKSEKRVLLALAQYSSKIIPAEIPYLWLMNRITVSKDEIDATVDSLVQKGLLVLVRERAYCLFAEELFRVFLAVAALEQREAQIRRAESAHKAQLRRREEEELARMIRSGDIDDLDALDELAEEDRAYLFEDIRNILFESKATTAWEAMNILDTHYGYDDDQYDYDYDDDY